MGSRTVVFLLWEILVLLCISYKCACDSDAELFITDGVLPALRIHHHFCALKMDEGPCKSIQPRFYFDIDTQKCEPFDYGGCQGNENKFDTLADCEEMCLVERGKDPCQLEEDPGPCRSIIIRYFFSTISQKCEPFMYGGCLGNANNFLTLKQCQDICHHKSIGVQAEPTKKNNVMDLQDGEKPKVPQTRTLNVPDFCLTPAEEGSCAASVKRYFYNSTQEKCQQFVYSGCGGNNNNFISKKDCRRTCMKGDKKESIKPKKRGIRIKKKNRGILIKAS
ncbi:tissue factor pathway inhibitor-like isoform X2 [Acipenser oxyrinchus oxyrinchus]|uniref:Tissue factor pathway inhibitor n=1 Tax=Acipenser oxyrinchus oxyrinchus TaxID=40147 RepID=A0AAD8D9C2_ACIOX|nr:tissue factor pathway inhibitor-like isoform X2 [Acipenser oxyrinchus oxyrinchus]